MLQEGGNAFDAVVAAQFAATVVEPVLTSLGGGGFLLAHPEHGQERVYDFFVHTPRQHTAAEADLYPVLADFGTATQEFHIGTASMATPGMVKGLLRIHRDLCSLPLRLLLEPAVEYARQGVRVTALHEYLCRVVAPILGASTASRAAFLASGGGPIPQGHVHRQPELADTLDALGREGARLFYRGTIAERLVRDCRERGGHLRADDLGAYRVLLRRPLHLTYRGARVATNPLPSVGGPLIAFSLKLLEPIDLQGLTEAERLSWIARTMELTNRARRETSLDDQLAGRHVPTLLRRSVMATYRAELLGHPLCSRGTTHISVIDRRGNAAAMTTSNGEGSGYVIPGTGVMMNNMLGEEDINPLGPGHWPRNRRMASMMAPTLLDTADGARISLGSGGSNRIRSAILQTLINLIDLRLPLRAAVGRPRIHYERGRLCVEGGVSAELSERLAAQYRDIQLWSERNLFFGGVHAVAYSTIHPRFTASGDPRRGGAAQLVD